MRDVRQTKRSLNAHIEGVVRRRISYTCPRSVKLQNLGCSPPTDEPGTSPSLAAKANTGYSLSRLTEQEASLKMRACLLSN